MRSAKEIVQDMGVGWNLKIKKDNLKFTNYWDVDITEDNGYYVLTPKSWKIQYLLLLQ